jgi:uncharacterized protein YsxB (DUF464 family)
MIQAKFLTSGATLRGFQISGHAGGEAGTDIVCAAVSSAAYLTANTITEVLGVNAEIACDEGFLSCLIPKEDAAKCDVILKGLQLHLFALAEQYPKNIHANNAEV